MDRGLRVDVLECHTLSSNITSIISALHTQGAHTNLVVLIDEVTRNGATKDLPKYRFSATYGLLIGFNFVFSSHSPNLICCDSATDSIV